MKINKFYQTLFDYSFGVKVTSLPKFRGIASKMYKYFVKKHRKFKQENYFINYRQGLDVLTLSTTHRLPYTLSAHKLYSMNLVRLCKYIENKKSNLKIIDIGANIGDTVFLISQAGNFPILCVEGNPEYLDLLEHNISKYNNVDIIKCFVGSKDIIENAKIVSDGFGSSTLKNSHSDDNFTFKTLSTIIKERPDFYNFNLLKIDTDGFDGEIIRNNIDFISKNKPTIFFEYAPIFLKNGIDSELILFKTLSNKGYNKFIFYNSLGEIMFVCDSSNELGINCAHEYFCRVKRYADIIAFHEDDNELFEHVLTEEFEFIKSFYKNNKI